MSDELLNEAVQGLQQDHVHVAYLATGDLNASQEASLNQQIGNSDIGIVVFTSSDRLEITDIPSFIAKVSSQSGYDTILVAFGNDFEAGSSDLRGGEAAQLASSTEGGDVYAGLTQFVSEVQTITSTRQPEPNAPVSDSNVGGLVGAVFVAIAALGALIFVISRRLKRRPGAEDSSPLASVPRDIQEKLARIAELANRIKNPITRDNLASAGQDVIQLFTRAKKVKGDQYQRALAQYGTVLDDVVKVAEVAIDVQSHPDYYEDPELELATIVTASTDYKRGVVQNVKELVKKGPLTAVKVGAERLASTVITPEPMNSEIERDSKNGDPDKVEYLAPPWLPQKRRLPPEYDVPADCPVGPP